MSRLSLSDSLVERILDSGYRVLITGATGWLGRASLEILGRVYGKGFVGSVNCFGSSRQTVHLRDGLSIDQQPLAAMGSVDRGRYILLHFACLAKDKVAGMSLDEYVATNRAISRISREAAERVGVDRIFLVSSGAVYQAMATTEPPSEPHPYGIMKLEEEHLFSSFAYDHAGSKVVTARLFNLSGPYVNKIKTYALSSFIEQIRDQGVGATIRINAPHPVIRSYVGVENLLNVAFAHLFDDTTAAYDHFDTAGDGEVEIFELAEIVRSIVNPAASILRPQFSAARADRYVGDGSKFRSLAVRYGIPLHDLHQQIRDTAEYLGAP